MIQQLIFHGVTPDRWVDLERLFEARGGPPSTIYRSRCLTVGDSN